MGFFKPLTMYSCLSIPNYCTHLGAELDSLMVEPVCAAKCVVGGWKRVVTT